MKKHLFWIGCGAVLVVQLLIYLWAVLPMDSSVEKRIEKLEKSAKLLRRFKRMGKEIPTEERVNAHQKNIKILKEEYERCKSKYAALDNEKLERWFPLLKRPPHEAPSLPSFKSEYADRMNGLRQKCEESGIEIVTAADEKSALPQPVSQKIQKATSGALKTKDLTQPKEHRGLWEAKEVTADSMRTAQKEYWIQEAFVESLSAAGGGELIFISFYREKKKEEKSARRPRHASRKEEKPKEKEKLPGIEQLLSPIPVTFFFGIKHENIGKLLSNFKKSSKLNLRFKGMDVKKLPISVLRMERKGLEYPPAMFEQKNPSLVFPKVMRGDSGRVAADFGKVPEENISKLPKQEALLSEPLVSVTLQYDILDWRPNIKE